MNRKTAGVELENGARWRVSYSYLIPVHETTGTVPSENLLEQKDTGKVRWLN